MSRFQDYIHYPANNIIPTCHQVIEKYLVIMDVDDRQDGGTDAPLYFQICSTEGVFQFDCRTFTIITEGELFERGTENYILLTAGDRNIVPYFENQSRYIFKIGTYDNGSNQPRWHLDHITVWGLKARFGGLRSFDYEDPIVSSTTRLTFGDHNVDQLLESLTKTLLNGCIDQWFEASNDVEYTTLQKVPCR